MIRHDVNSVNVIPPALIVNPNKHAYVSSSLLTLNLNNKMVCIQPSDLLFSKTQNNRN